MTSIGIPREYHTQIMSQKGFNVLWPLVTESSKDHLNFNFTSNNGNTTMMSKYFIY
jgi:hypothetical protein